MSTKIGFVILSYDEPQRLLELMRTLNAMFDEPAMVCHHNFGQCNLDEDQFPRNAQFVHPHVYTRWGHITTPLAALRAFRFLREYADPEWFVMLSGSDYPVRSAQEIKEELRTTPYDAYLDHREIRYNTVPPNQTATDGGFGRPDWIRIAYDRYCATRIWVPRPSKARLLSGRFPFRNSYLRVRHPSIVRRIQPHRPARVYGGKFWFQANRKAIGRLLCDPALPKLIRYFRRRPIPEESLFHTVLCNQMDLRICNDSKRYEDWTAGGPSPKFFELSDLPKILRSNAHFARKFRSDQIVQKHIDRAVLRIG